MVVLADEILESFFETDFSATFKLEPVPMMDIPGHTGLLGELWTSITSDDNKKMFNRFTDGVGRAVGKHQVGQTSPLYVTCVLIRFPVGIPPPRYRQVHGARRA